MGLTKKETQQINLGKLSDKIHEFQKTTIIINALNDGRDELEREVVKCFDSITIKDLKLRTAWGTLAFVKDGRLVIEREANNEI